MKALPSVLSVVADHWHGITLLGAINALVVNNTVLDVNGEKPGPPWIKLGDHKNGTPSSGVVRNNLTTDVANEGNGVTEDANIIIDDAKKFFVAPPYDVHLLATAPAIDKGTSDKAPNIDIDGIPRPQGSAHDVGAYEWHDGSAVPDAGTGGGGGGPGAGGTPGAGGGSAGSGAAGGAGGSGAAAGSAGSGANSATDKDASDDSGCACRTAPRSTSSLWWLALSALALARLRRRRA